MRLEILLTWLAMIGVALGAGYVNDTNRTESYNYGVSVAQLSWGSTGYIQAVSANTADPVRGHISRVVSLITHASTNGTPYILTIKDQNGIDVLSDLGASLATNATHNMAPTTNSLPWAVNEKLSITVTNCGSNATGLIYLYLSRP